MSYVKEFKKSLHCCIAKKTAELIELQDNLINDTKLKNEIRLLNLFDFTLNGVDCDDIISSQIKSKILSLCGYNDCFDCNNTSQEIIIENWTPDPSDLSTEWIEYVVECEKDMDHEWVEFNTCCEQDTDYEWIAFIECCQQE